MMKKVRTPRPLSISLSNLDVTLGMKASQGRLVKRCLALIIVAVGGMPLGHGKGILSSTLSNHDLLYDNEMSLPMLLEKVAPRVTFCKASTGLDISMSCRILLVNFSQAFRPTPLTRPSLFSSGKPEGFSAPFASTESRTRDTVMSPST